MSKVNEDGDSFCYSSPTMTRAPQIEGRNEWKHKKDQIA